MLALDRQRPYLVRRTWLLAPQIARSARAVAQCHPVGTLVAYDATMERPFYCPDCGTEHDEPSDGRLGHLVPCLDCALHSELIAITRAIEEMPRPIAA